MTHRFLHRSGYQSIRHSRGFHAEGLVRPPGVVKADPFSDDTRGVLLGSKAMTMYALLFQRSDHALDHAVLLGGSAA